MILTEQNICYYLLDKGLIDISQIVDGKFRVDSLESRNKNFVVNKNTDNSYFIKHIKIHDAEKINTLQTEATFYWLAFNESEYAGLRPFLPQFHYFDYNNNVLVIGYEKECVTLQEFFDRNQNISDNIAPQIGSLLSMYHSDISDSLLKTEAPKFFKKNKPWVFSLGHVSKNSNVLSGQGENQMMKLIDQNQKYKELIGSLENKWEYSSIIHGDIKFMNLLVQTDPADLSKESIKLIDWELTDIGDPCWDVAAVFQAYLILWVIHEISSGQQQNGLPLTVVQHSIRNFWLTYSLSMKRNPEDFLLKAMEFCALKMIHSCLEITSGSENLSSYGVRLLQLSFNILNNPQHAKLNVFGIS